MTPRVRTGLAVLAWLLPLLLTVLAYRASLGFGLVGDAVFLIRDNAFMREWGDLWGLVTHGYFWSSSGEIIGYWRPLTKASWLVETLLGGGSPAVHHLVQIAWLLVGITGVQALGRDLGLPRVHAAAAAALVGLHPATIEAACLVMARSDVVVMAAMVWAILLWRIAWRTGRTRWGALHLLALGVALGSKEVGVVIPAVLGLVWAVERGWRTGWRRSLVALGPPVALTLVYLVLRGAVLGDGSGARLALDPLRWFATGGAYLAGLAPFRLETGVRNLPVAEAMSAPAILRHATAWAVFVAIAAWVAHRGRRQLPLVGWMALVMAPVLLVEAINVPNVDGKFPMADRWLFHAVAPAALLFAGLAAELRGPWASRLVGAAFCLWVVASLAVSGDTHHWYRDSRSLLERDAAAYAATPEAFRTPQDRCVQFERLLLVDIWDAGDRAIEDLDGRLRVYREELGCVPGDDLRFNLASHHVRRGEYLRARPLLRALLEGGRLGREEATARLLAGVVEVHAGDPGQGLVLLAAARGLGLEDCRIDLEEAQALQRLRRAGPAARAFEAAYRCRAIRDGVQDPNLLFAAVLLQARSGATAAQLAPLVAELDGVPMEPELRAAFDAWRRGGAPGQSSEP
jgi:hypothetical protein